MKDRGRDRSNRRMEGGEAEDHGRLEHRGGRCGEKRPGEEKADETIIVKLLLYDKAGHSTLETTPIISFDSSHPKGSRTGKRRGLGPCTALAYECVAWVLSVLFALVFIFPLNTAVVSSSGILVAYSQ